MNHHRSERLAILLLVLGLATATLPAVSLAAPPGANLGITYDGFNPSSADRVIRFKISNVGTEPTGATEVHIETFRGSPTNNFTTPSIPTLAVGASFEVYYALYKKDGTPGCDGAIVRATVYLGNDVDRSNDSTGPVEVCADLPPPPAPIIVGPAPNSIPVPAYATPGDHPPVDLQPSIVRSYFLDRFLTDTQACGPLPYNRSAEAGSYRFVGWFQLDDDEGFFSPDCRYVGEGQTAVNFDLSMFDNIRNPAIQQAVLTIGQEHDQNWRDLGGPVSGCVASLGRPTAQWDGPNVNYEPIPQESQAYRDVSPGNASQFDVTSEVAQWVHNDRPRWGLVLRGSLSIDQLEGRGSSSCLSTIDGLMLRVTYSVPS